jgi:hypothetical protein
MRNWESKHNCISPETDATKVSSFPIIFRGGRREGQAPPYDR